MHDARQDRADEVTRLVEARLPGYRVASVAWLGEGLDSVAYEVNDELVVRISRETDPARRAELVDREARLLAVVARVSPLPVPEPRFTDLERGCLAYPRLPGSPLQPLVSGPWRVTVARPVAATLGAFLAALHAVPAERVAGLVDTDAPTHAEWLAEAAEHYAAVAGTLSSAVRRRVEAFLAAPPPERGTTRVPCHNDLGAEHVLVDAAGTTVTGVIDWTDAALADPAHDFALIHRDLGPAALDTALRAYRPGAEPAGLRARAAFYARCVVFEDLAYGHATGRRTHIEAGRAALGWLFPA